MKPKIIIDREPISSAEILQRKNFQKLAADAKLMQKAFYQSNWFISGLAVAGVALITTVLYFTLTETSTDETTLTQNESIEQSQKQEQKTNYSEDSPCINPPIQGAEKKYSVYTFDAAKGAEIKHPSGTVLSIPANSIVDASGKIISGMVTLNYREFHDQVDILLSGIPMNYDSAGYSYQFESAGMIDMYATQNGNTVALKDGEKINIQFASRVAGTHFNVYELDTNQRNWVYIGKDQVKAVADVKNNSTQEKTKVNNEVDELLAMKKDPVINKLTTELTVIKTEISQISNQEPKAPKAVDKNKYNFNLDVDQKEFPEFSSFAQTRFEVGSENKGFTEEIYKTVWEDVLLSENKKGINYKLTLKKGTQSKSFIVYPVFEGLSLEQAQQVYEQKFKEYDQRLNSKKAEELQKEKELKAEELRWKKEAQANKEKAQKELVAQNTNQNTTNNSETYVNSNLSQYGLVQIGGQVQNINGVTIPSNNAVVTRTFQTDGFGTFNCDTPAKWPKGANVQASFTDIMTTKKVQGDVAYLVIANKNLYFPYFPSEWFNFCFNPKDLNAIVMPLRNGQVAYFSTDNFKTIDSKKTHADFRMTVSEKTITTESEFRAFLNQN